MAADVAVAAADAEAHAAADVQHLQHQAVVAQAPWAAVVELPADAELPVAAADVLVLRAVVADVPLQQHLAVVAQAPWVAVAELLVAAVDVHLQHLAADVQALAAADVLLQLQAVADADVADVR